MPNIDPEALYNACYHGDATAVSRLLLLPAGGTRVNLSGPAFQCPEQKTTPLLVAAMHGHTAIVKMILERAPDTTVDCIDADGDTPLLMASQFLHADNVQLLAELTVHLFPFQLNLSCLVGHMSQINP
jgi:ankyrin repeat protein